MVARRALVAAGCSHCRSSILKLFVARSSLTPLVRTRAASTWHATIATQTKRNYSSAPKSLEAPEEEDSHYRSKTEAEERGELAASPPPPAEQSNTSEIPWYLQVQAPRHAAAAEPPPLPEIPLDSPAIVNSLVEYASEEMGLDELSLLDLRELDPPPALGPNLFMLFGTARSERHLNVSAGRLVRWLRAKHHIYADADGLLGPNERKTKLKRKAKRAKLMGTMGTDDADDGISTGWICVNLGTINRGSEQSTVVSEDGRVAGFGVPQIGSTIVVQIMTESRRSELTLETLWQRSLARQLKKNVAPTSIAASEVYADELTTFSPKVHARPTTGTTSSSDPVTAVPGQFRSFSTNHHARLHVQDATTSQDYADPLLSDAATLSDVLSYDGRQKERLLELLHKHILSLEPRSAVATLGNPSFHKLTNLATENMQPEHTWTLRLALETVARRTSPSHMSLEPVRGLMKELRLQNIPAPREQYLQLLFCIYSSPGCELDEQTTLALELLESLQLRGQPIIANDIIVSIIEATSWSERPGEEAMELQSRLEELILHARLPYMEEHLLQRLMDAYARQRSWFKFWELWRIPPRYMRRRSENMYLHVLRLVADTKSPVFCHEAVRRCFQEMISESPPVRPVGQVGEAMLDCIRVADPHAEDHATALSPRAIGPMRRLANRELVKVVRSIKLMT